MAKCKYRARFNTWKKSREAFEVSRSLIRKALYLCPICKSSLSLGEGHLFHIISIKLLATTGNCINLVSLEDNLLYSCKKCNLKQRDKIYTECLEDNLLNMWNKLMNNKNISSKDKGKEVDTKETTSKTSIDKISLKNKEDDRDIQE